ncbi:hypothetical protein V6N13_063857 [Hibiscus sabdariffa]
MFGNGRLESSPVGNSPIAIHLDASQSLALMTSKLCYETGKLGFLGLLLSRAMSISVTLSELKSWLYTDDRILITWARDGQVRHARILECGVKTRLLAKHQGNAYVVGSDQYARLYDIRKFKCHGSTDFGRPIYYFYPLKGNSVYLFTHDMGLGNKPVPYSPSSACSEANGKAIPQVYKGHGKKRIWMV